MRVFFSRCYALSVVLVLYEFSSHVAALHTSLCIRFPEDSTLDGSYGETGDKDVASVGVEKFPPNIWDKYAHSLEFNNDGIGKPTTTTQIYDDNNLDLRIDLFPITGRPSGSGDPLNGWFRIKVSTNVVDPFTELFKSFVLFATDDQYNFVGTFEHDAFPEGHAGCPHSDATKHMIIPCGGVSKYEPFASNVILFARNKSAWPDQYKEYWPIVPQYTEDELNFYFRYSIQATNRNSVAFLIIRIIADPDENYTADFIHNVQLYKNTLLSAAAYFQIRKGAVPGAADPLASDRTRLGCENPTKTMQGKELAEADILRDKFFEKNKPDGYLQKNFQWFFKVGSFYADPSIERTAFGAGRNHDMYALTVYTKTGCSARYFEGRCDSTLCSKSNEGTGTADPSTKRNKAIPGLIPQVRSTGTPKCFCSASRVPTKSVCWHEDYEIPTLFNNEKTTFHDCIAHYKDQFTGRGSSDRCAMTEDEVNAINIKVIRRKPVNITIITVNGNITYIGGNGTSSQLLTDRAINRRGVRVYGFGTVLFAVRKGHGIVMLIMTFFCVPVSIFVSRYYKETFMTKRILYSRVWFQIHIQLSFWMWTFVVAGLLLAFVGRGFLGVSLHPYGIMHRVFGWISIVIFIIIACTGGIRMYSDPGRCCTILAHFLIGYSLYIFNMLSVISSIHVPGSPIAQHDKSIDENIAKEKSLNYVYIGITFWIIFELVVHVSMNVLLSMYDRWMQVEEPRKYIPPLIGVPIPILKQNTAYDASGHGIRLISFWIYIGVSALCAFLSVGICISSKPSLERGFGPMSCTHEWNSSLSDALYHSVKYQMRKSLDPSCIYT